MYRVNVYFNNNPFQVEKTKLFRFKFLALAYIAIQKLLGKREFHVLKR